MNYFGCSKFRNNLFGWKQIIITICFFSLIWIVLKKPSFQQNRYKSPKQIDDCLYHPQKQRYALSLQPKKRTFELNQLKINDFNRLVDLHNFRYLINEPNKCKNASVLLLVLITSSPTNFKKRLTIRTTWGYRDSKTRILFMLGHIDNSEVQNKINLEHAKFGDIVQGNFIDSYKNLTYKSVMALKYAVYYCANAVYVIKSDDDVFINMPLMKNYLTNDLSPFGAYNLLQCYVFENNKPIRDASSKWSVTESEYPANKYPTYCNGAWALFSPDILFKIYKEAQKLPFFYLEDVFLYGMAGGNVKGLYHSDITDLTLSYYWSDQLSSGIYDRINFLFGNFGMDDKAISELWDYVKNRPISGSVYDYTNIE